MMRSPAPESPLPPSLESMTVGAAAPQAAEERGLALGQRRDQLATRVARLEAHGVPFHERARARREHERLPRGDEPDGLSELVGLQALQHEPAGTAAQRVEHV